MLGFLVGSTSVGGGVLLLVKQPEIAGVGWCLVGWGALLLLGFGYHCYDKCGCTCFDFKCCRETPSYYHPKVDYSSLTLRLPSEPPLQQIMQQTASQYLAQQDRFTAQMQAQNHANYMQQCQANNREAQMQSAQRNQTAINAMQHQASQHNYHIYTMSRHH